jgi:hypothetical protein
MKRVLILFLSLNLCAGYSQFPPQVGQLGTTAIYKDSSLIINWATNCKIVRGWQDISNTSLGKATTGDSSMAIGPANGTGIVSLGDGGSAILTFETPIKNGNGFDFCVFENGFDGFLELAFVEVSSDGVNFFRFPATSNTQTLTQKGSFDNSGDATKLNNLAGKYTANYGTPFDLQDLLGTLGLDVNTITHIKIIDVVGNINAPYATYDKNNNPINDPWTTPFASGGFDLDAVGVINQQAVGIGEYSDLNTHIHLFPNPCQTSLYLDSSIEIISELNLKNELGFIVYSQKYQINETIIDTSCLPAGFYTVEFMLKNGNRISKKIIKN